MLRDTEKFWREEFGDEYTQRNRVNWEARVPFWKHIIGLTDAASALEIGCNAGWNLNAIRESDQNICLCGVDINQSAVDEARGADFSVWVKSAGERLGRQNFDLTFTAGLLIHIAPDDLKRVMANIADASRRYVLAVEYADEKEVEVEYRGHSAKLWRRPYGKLYEELGLRLVDTDLLTKDQGFDQCTYWLMRV